MERGFSLLLERLGMGLLYTLTIKDGKQGILGRVSDLYLVVF